MADDNDNEDDLPDWGDWGKSSYYAQLGQFVSFIRRLYQAERKPLPVTVGKSFDHLKTITSYRNDLLHYGIDSADEANERATLCE
jgi:hypothetical protein